MILPVDIPRHRVGLIGADIGPSLSPALHEREAQHLGLSYVYERLDITTLGLAPEAVGGLLRVTQRLGFSGVNITHPCKQEVVGELTRLSTDAAALGAVNTVVFDHRGAVGHNTDCQGFQESFVRGLPDVATRRVVLLGAGGAGSAVGHGLLALGIEELAVCDTDRDRALAIADSLGKRHGAGRAAVIEPTGLGDALRRADGIVNATPSGMRASPGPALDPDLLHDGLWVAEVVYRPLETELLQHARRLGCRTLDGGGMAVFQAALSFELFTGVRPDRERMLRHFATLAEDDTAVGIDSERG
ncbi:MAG TPA: shikimate dehydrogenase [Solirubrobacteraceae bacterium]